LSKSHSITKQGEEESSNEDNVNDNDDSNTNTMPLTKEELDEQRDQQITEEVIFILCVCDRVIV
jgi:hypothetical protein